MTDYKIGFTIDAFFIHQEIMIHSKCWIVLHGVDDVRCL